MALWLSFGEFGRVVLVVPCPNASGQHRWRIVDFNKLWELLLHAWIGVFGVGEFSARFLPTLFSSLAVFFIHRIGMEHQGIRQATMASALFTLSNYHMVFAHEARVYPLLVLLTSASFYAFQRTMREPAQGRWWVAWVVTNVALLYSHYFGLFVLASQTLLWLVNGKLRRNAMRQWLVSVGVLVLAYLPLMVVVVRRFWASASEGTWIAPVRHLNPLKMVVTTLSNGHVLGYAILVLAAVCIAVTISEAPCPESARAWHCWLRVGGLPCAPPLSFTCDGPLSTDPQTVGHGLDVDAGRASLGLVALEGPPPSCDPNVDGVVCLPVACHVHGILLDPHVH